MIGQTPQLDWLLLTKRPENIDTLTPERFVPNGKQPIFPGCPGPLGEPVECFKRTKFRENVWLGTSVENQAAADDRIPQLAIAPAVVKFLSCEPLLGPVDIRRTMPRLAGARIDWVIVGGESGKGARPCDLKDVYSIVNQCKAAALPVFVKQLGARPWIDRNHPECNVQLEKGADEEQKRQFALGLGEYLEHCYTFELQDKKGGDWDEWPEDLRVREFPR